MSKTQTPKIDFCCVCFDLLYLLCVFSIHMNHNEALVASENNENRKKFKKVKWKS